MSHQQADAIDVAAIREEFPILQREFDGQQVVYLDNAATTQTPDPVVDAMSDYYRESNANVHRGIHHLSQEASEAYEVAHDRVAEFINADGREEVVFTKNTTESENLLAYSWGLNELGPEDTVVLTEMEHHASLVTWQQIAKRTGASVEYIRVDETGRLDMDHAVDLIDDDTAIVSAVHVSNTLGTVNPVSELTNLAHEHDALSFIDGAQAVPNRPVDVKEIDADFYAFSGHKMAGPTGIGVLYGKQDLLEDLNPYLYGGGMIRKVTFEDSTWGELPWKFEPGTPPIAEAVGLHAAVDWLEEIGMDRIETHEEELAAYAYDRLEAEEDVEIYGPEGGPDRGGLVSFNLEGVHAHDLTSIMNDHTIAVRAGDHCTQPLHDKLGVPASTRASFYVYNTREEIDKLVAALDDARQLFA
ncbi:cysteine desulfurase [Natrialba magadii ATCC 43099]|uniref:cysteine desulfurase n=1 Tax=Natrialba magadii (strain ATCC 43099 / DSM 3394 / CCM 3739 / CIP 104546 / IAM 13178 / JCM 8861 / NBRC 102185 / NCIMB 2190 / MS3) TaxID=547559 RepID=D3SV05_NATMM|nr:cysteine desulfurase [Natrialba magadii]ADD05413.1 cysteine desulfurase [Natrialba magadii ATCC 43099]ELY29273.1 cysteine desulfurase [Natrialba magadii ATCC 43099]